jgi:hypothetical protein
MKKKIFKILEIIIYAKYETNWPYRLCKRHNSHESHVACLILATLAKLGGRMLDQVRITEERNYDSQQQSGGLKNTNLAFATLFHLGPIAPSE